ncbi:MAG: (d)CMP kinase [Gammaproteobacteria bacterium]|nr:(d)CMP kinase [Gammaproteobacteria bacterium]
MTDRHLSAPVICVDGPSGSGKGSLATALAERLGWRYLDSGALYRVIGAVALERGVATDNEAALASLAQGLEIKLADGRIGADGIDLSQRIRDEAVAAAASEAARHPQVRQAILDQQRRAADGTSGLVADGRDMGTVVFPGAELKIFLDASVEERAQRRHKQLRNKGVAVNLRKVLANIRDRDERDERRAASPLRPASDAVIIDSTHMAIADVLRQALDLARERGLAEAPPVASQEQRKTSTNPRSGRAPHPRAASKPKT